MTTRTPRLALFTGLLAVALPTGAHATQSASEPGPRLEAPPRYASDDAGGPGRLDNAGWWKRFSDPGLDALVSRGLEDNLDLATARSRIDEAEAQVIVALAPLMPTASWDSTVTTAPLDSLGFQFGGAAGGGGGGAPAQNLPELYYTASSALNVGVEIPLTGRNILSHRASKRDLRATKDDLDDQKRLLTQSIVSAYYDVAAAKAQLDIVRKQVEINESLLELTQARFEAGSATAVEVLQQRQQLAASKTLVPQAEIQVQAFSQQLAVLLGEPPGRNFSVPDQLPALPPHPEVGSPSDLAESRPDLRALAHRLEAASDRKKSARRQFAPSLRLSGQYGVQALRIQDWRSQGFWNLGVTLSVPLSTGGATWGRAKQATAAERTAARQLDASTLTALREVEDALVRERKRQEMLEAYREQAAAAEAAFEESRQRYAVGLSEYLTVLAALNTHQQSELSVVTAHRDLIAARIALHTALGDSRR